MLDSVAAVLPTTATLEHQSEFCRMLLLKRRKAHYRRGAADHVENVRLPPEIISN